MNSQENVNKVVLFLFTHLKSLFNLEILKCIMRIVVCSQMTTLDMLSFRAQQFIQTLVTDSLIELNLNAIAFVISRIPKLRKYKQVSIFRVL